MRSPACNVETRLVFEAVTAGMIPKMIAAAKDTLVTNASTRRSTPASAARGMLSPISERIAGVQIKARPHPIIPPDKLSTTLSTSNTPNDPSAACSPGCAHRNLALQCVHARQQQVCDVAASNQQHQHNGTEYDHESCSRIADQCGKLCSHSNRVVTCIRIGILFREAFRNDVQVLVDLFNRNARFHFPDIIQEAHTAIGCCRILSHQDCCLPQASSQVPFSGDVTGKRNEAGITPMTVNKVAAEVNGAPNDGLVAVELRHP